LGQNEEDDKCKTVINRPLEVLLPPDFHLGSPLFFSQGGPCVPLLQGGPLSICIYQKLGGKLMGTSFTQERSKFHCDSKEKRKPTQMHNKRRVRSTNCFPQHRLMKKGLAGVERSASKVREKEPARFA